VFRLIGYNVFMRVKCCRVQSR